MLRIHFPGDRDPDPYHWGSAVVARPGIDGASPGSVLPVVMVPRNVTRYQEDVDIFINDVAWEIAKSDPYLAVVLPRLKGPNQEAPEGYVRIQDYHGA